MPKRELDDAFEPASKRSKMGKLARWRRKWNRRDFRLLIQTPLSPLPRFHEVVLKTTWVGSSSIAAALVAVDVATGGGGQKTFSFTNIFDPFGSSGSQQPYGLDKLVTLYDQYRVIAAKLVCHDTNTATTLSSTTQTIYKVTMIHATGVDLPSIDGFSLPKCIDNPKIRAQAIPPSQVTLHGRTAVAGTKKSTIRVWIPNWFKRTGPVESTGSFADYWNDVDSGAPANFNVDYHINWVCPDMATDNSATVLEHTYTMYQRVQFKDPRTNLDDA